MLLANAATFAVSAWLLAGLRLPSRAASEAGPQHGPGLRRAVATASAPCARTPTR